MAPYLPLLPLGLQSARQPGKVGQFPRNGQAVPQELLRRRAVPQEPLGSSSGTPGAKGSAIAQGLVGRGAVAQELLGRRAVPWRPLPAVVRSPGAPDLPSGSGLPGNPSMVEACLKQEVLVPFKGTSNRSFRGPGPKGLMMP